MKVHGKQTTAIEVDVSEIEILGHAIKIIRRLHDLERDAYVRDDDVIYDEDYHHGSPEEIILRKATQEDKDAYAAIQYLEKAKFDFHLRK